MEKVVEVSIGFTDFNSFQIRESSENIWKERGCSGGDYQGTTKVIGHREELSGD